ncbi:hypothetical protein [Geomesophilobacter sediminis]|uniref:Uncharacterized protein n=1 Tax=Geomesophilobacter sediminis TaxID=2798584 RepID=A0A8J7IY19_9BACT|nr:hypothetical protein [Geomesophilobacter sediminis]MBJ6724967.1 hypothetical protein [Geomesophilobacter sediminis]
MKASEKVLQTTIEIAGREYEVAVFRRESDRHYAVTRFSESDVIVCDGGSLEETLSIHVRSLPLAVSCRRHGSDTESDADAG